MQLRTVSAFLLASLTPICIATAAPMATSGLATAVAAMSAAAASPSVAVSAISMTTPSDASGGALDDGRSVFLSPLSRPTGTDATITKGAIRLDFQKELLDALPVVGGFSLVQFPLPDGTSRDLELSEFEVLSVDGSFVVMQQGPNGELVPNESMRPRVRTFRGAIAGEPDSLVFLSFASESIGGFISAHGTTYSISSGPRGQMQPAISDLESLPEGAINWRQFACATTDESKPGVGGIGDGGVAALDTCRVLKMAFETDNEYRAQLFNTDQAALDYLEQIAAGMSVIFYRDENLYAVLEVARVYSPSTTDPWTAGSAFGALDQFSSLYASIAPPGALGCAVKHFISAKNLGGGVAEAIGGTCRGQDHCVSGEIEGFFPYPLQDNSLQNWDIFVTTHETGHLLGCWHTHQQDLATPPGANFDTCAFGGCANASAIGTIMSYCHLCPGGIANIDLRFAPPNIDNMDRYLQQQGGAGCSGFGDCVPVIELFQSTPTTCGRSDGALDITVRNATAISWSGPNGYTSAAIDIAGLASGTYRATATGPGGTVSADFTVAATPDTVAPTITAFPAVSTTPALPKCWGLMPDLRSQVVAVDNCGSQSITIVQTPAVGTELGLNGPHAVTFKAIDWAGNESAVVNATISVTGVPTQYFLDADSDSYGDPFTHRLFCAPSEGWVLNSGDCNDGSAEVRPGADELCNRSDDDCNGIVDDGLNGQDYYTDADQDAYGSMYAAPQYACTPVSGKVTNRWDCNDGSASIRPGAEEACDSVDNNCDGTIDEDCPDASFAVSLRGNMTAIAAGDMLRVTAAATTPPSLMRGVFVRLDFDEAVLRLVSIEPAAGSPFPIELQEYSDPATGLIQYEIGLPGKGSPMSAAGDLFDLSFEVVSVPAGCQPVELLAFAPGDTLSGSTHFVRIDGALIAPPVLNDLTEVRFGNVRAIAWGRNDAGQSSAPQDLGSIVGISAGDAHAGAVRLNGTAVFWGSNANGRALGTNAAGQPILGVADGTPVKYLGSELTGIVEISAGGSHSLAVVSGGLVRAWGLNTNGQTNVPVSLGAAASVAAGQLHSLALRGNGEVVGWGYNAYGQCLGTNAAGSAITGAALGTPVRLLGLTLNGVTQISAGAHHSLAITVDGTARCWGFNQFQQCSVPAGLGVVVDIAGGDYHSLALRPDGSVVGWGLNSSSQSSIPGGLGSVVAIAAGGSHSAAVLADGTVRCWGANSDGQCNVPAAAREIRDVDLGSAYSVALSTPPAAVSVAPNGDVDATCGRCNGSIDVTICNADGWQWTGPNGFSSQAQDLTNLCPGVYTITVSGVGGNGRLTVEILATPDTEAPVMTQKPAARSSNDSTNLECKVAVPNFLDPASGYAVRDNCTASDLLTVTQSPAPGTPVGLGVHEITFSILDSSGNTGTATTTFTVTENAGEVADICGCGVVNRDVYPPARGSVPAGNGIADCADITTKILGTDLDENGEIDLPEYPWNGGYFKVRVRADFASTWNPESPLFAVAGAQFAMRYDTSKLDFVLANPIPDSGFAGELAEVVDEQAGTLLYAIYSLPGTPGMTSNAEIFELWFWVEPGISLCQDDTAPGFRPLVSFSAEPINGFTSRMIRLDSTPQLPILEDLPVLKRDMNAPVVTVSGVWAPNQSAFAIPADADLVAGARIAAPTVVVRDDCDPDPSLDFKINGVSASNWPKDGIFPVGITTLSWTATDSASRPTTVTRTIEVLDYKLVDIVLSFGSQPFPEEATRQIRLSERNPSAAGGLAYQDLLVRLQSSVLAAVRVPTARQAGDCVTAKDLVHSLRRRANLEYQYGPTGEMTRRFELRMDGPTLLVQGDSDDDNRVDITDYGLWVIDRGTLENPTALRDARSNFNGDEFVNSADFTFLATPGVYFSIGDAECGTSAAQGNTARERVSVKQLRREGRGELAAADLNGDGWLDIRDIQLALQGGVRAAPSTE